MLDPLETILRQCAEAAPAPWYPSAYARMKGITRDELDPHLDRLRMAGLIHLTDWVQGNGQGYALTPDGEYVLKNPRELANLRAGKLYHAAEVFQEPASTADRGTTAFERGEEIRAAFLYPSPPVISLTLIFVNVVWFLAEVFLSVRHQLPLNEFLVGFPRQPGHALALQQVLSETGALSGLHIVQGEWWRLLTCCFVHIGLIHLGVNMWVLYAVGPFFEQLWGRGRFLVLYLIAGLGGSCTMAIFNPTSLGAGASGAIWGLLSAHLVWIILNRRYLPPSLASQMLRRIVFNLLLNVVLTYSVPNISASAHFGGGVVGGITAFLLNIHRYAGSRQRRLALLGLIAIPVLSVGAVVAAQWNEPRWQGLRFQHIYQDNETSVRNALEGKLQLLGAQLPKVHSLQEVQEAIAALDNARAFVYRGIDQLQQAGPVKNPAAEVDRRSFIQRFEEQAHLCELEELQNWIQPLLADLIRQAARVYQQEHDALQKLEVPERTPEVVEQAISRCRQARLEVEAVLNIVRGMKPYRNPKLEAKRLAITEEEEERLRGWERTEERMRRLASAKE